MDYSTTEGQMKLAGDLLYAGLLGQALRDERPIPSWGETMDLFDEFSKQSDFSEQFVKMFDVYKETEWAKKLLEVTPSSESSDKKKVKK